MAGVQQLAAPAQWRNAYCSPEDLGGGMVPDGAVECGDCLQIVPDVPRCAYCSAGIEGYTALQMRSFDANPRVPLSVCLLLTLLRLLPPPVQRDEDMELTSDVSTTVPSENDNVSFSSRSSGTSTTELETDVDDEPTPCHPAPTTSSPRW